MAFNIEIEIHTHNDFGMAAANSLAAVEAGAGAISTTVCGIGERAGNASLEGIVIALNKVLTYPVNLRVELLPKVTNLVAKAARLNMRHHRISITLPGFVSGKDVC